VRWPKWFIHFWFFFLSRTNFRNIISFFIFFISRSYFFPTYFYRCTLLIYNSMDLSLNSSQVINTYDTWKAFALLPLIRCRSDFWNYRALYYDRSFPTRWIIFSLTSNALRVERNRNEALRWQFCSDIFFFSPVAGEV
jgi:hypothetical protein